MVARFKSITPGAHLSDQVAEVLAAEHAELRDLNRRLAEPDCEILARFATLLHDHVRFEERELFETAQDLLYPEH